MDIEGDDSRGACIDQSAADVIPCFTQAQKADSKCPFQHIQKLPMLLEER
jgi:hypothetical protein